MASTAPDLLAGSIVPTLVRLASPNVLGLLLQSLGALYGVIGLSFLVYALVPGVAFRLGAWAPVGDQTARG